MNETKNSVGTLFACVVLVFALQNCVGLSAEVTSEAAGKYGFSIVSGPNRELIWEVVFPDGKKRALDETDKKELLERTIFPQVLADSKAGIEPEVWKIGFFYLDGLGTARNLQKAEAAFRKGIELGKPEGLLFLGDYFHERGIRGEGPSENRKKDLLQAERIYREILKAGHEEAASFAISLSTAHLFGWYGLKADPERSDSLLHAVEEAAPDNPFLFLWKAKSLVHQKQYLEAFDFAEKAQNRFFYLSNGSKDAEEQWKLARAIKITAAILGGEISRIDPEEFMETSKESLGLTGRSAWFVPGFLALILGFLLWRSSLSWQNEEKKGPGIRLSLLWISAATLAAGIGFNIRLPGLDNHVGHWIGAIFVVVAAVIAVSTPGISRYFGEGTWICGPKPIFKAILIIVAGIAGLQAIAIGYATLFEFFFDRKMDQQLVSLFLKNESLPQMLGTLLIVGVAIPFYEELFFRGFLFDALDRRWGGRTALTVTSVFFALIHGFTFAIPLLFLSFVLAWLRLRSGNLRMCVLLHAANNSFAVLIAGFSSGSS